MDDLDKTAFKFAQDSFPSAPLLSRRLCLQLFQAGVMTSLVSALAACSSFPAQDEVGAAPTTPVTSQPLPPPDGAAASGVQGAPGAVKIGAVLPLTQNGAVSQAGTALRNAITLAVNDIGGNQVTLLVEDDQSTPEGAQQAAQKLIAGGAEIILGPLYAATVRAVASVAKANNRPVIAFSTDPQVASHGVYLLSFLIDSYVDQVVGFAASKGKKSFAALLPDNDYGRLCESAFQAAVTARNLSLVAVEKYRPDQIGAAVSHLSALPQHFDTLFVGEQVAGLDGVMQVLAAQKLVAPNVQILGPGLWSDPAVFKNPLLQGAWFAGADQSGYNAFATRYRQKFGQDPLRIATLGFDAGSLAAALAKMPAPHFPESILTNRAGFNGADGLFRFLPDGTNERGMAIFEIRNGTATAIQPAPKAFPKLDGQG